MEKNTHLKIPKENIINEKFTPPAGGKSYIRDNYSEHGKKLFEKTIKIKKLQSQKKDAKYTNDFFFGIETPPDIKVKQTRNRIEKLGFQLISYSKEKDNIATVKIGKQEFELFENKVLNYANKEGNPNKSYISPIEDLNDISIEEKIDTNLDLSSEKPESIIISLYNVLSSKEKYAILDNIQVELSINGIKSEIHTFINGLTTITCTISPKLIKSIFEGYSTVREISKNQMAIIEQSMPVQKLPNPINISSPKSNSKIGIIDSGIETSVYIFSSLVAKRFPFLPKNSHASPNDHGSFVASRCLFGDSIDQCLVSHNLEPYCKIVDIAVFGLDSQGKIVAPSEIHLMKALEYIIPNTSKDVLVYNISLGFNSSIKNNSFSLLAKLIDFLSKKYGVLFIISAGNIRSQLGGFPEKHFDNKYSRIASPAESLLSISVGSIAKFENINSLSKTNQVSPFSRIGPGADNGLKPELVAHGGNLSKGYSYLPRLSTYGISKDGINLSVDNGTSFSAPIIAQYAQRLFDLYPNADSNLIKALLFHFAEPRLGFDLSNIPHHYFTGFGEPNIESALYAGPNSCTYLYEGEISNNTYQFIKFHVPSLLSVDNPDSKLKIKITLVYDPEINPDNDVEYSSVRMAMNLLKPTDNGNKDVNLSSDEKFNLPWNPIIKFEKSFSRKYAVGEWFVRLRLYTRNINDDSYIQNYAIVIEVIDEKSKINVYNEVLNEYGQIYQKIILQIAA